MVDGLFLIERGRLCTVLGGVLGAVCYRMVLSCLFSFIDSV